MTTAPTPTAAEVEALVGTPLHPAVIVVERGPVARFAEAVRDTSPAYGSPDAARELGLPGMPVPPTYLFAAAHWGTFAERQPPVPAKARTLADLVTSLRADGGMVLHGSHEFTYLEPVCVGDELHISGVVEDVVVKPGRDGRRGMTAMTIRTDYRGPDGGLRATTRATFLHKPSDPVVHT